MKTDGTWLSKALARTRADLPARQKQKPLALLRTFAKAAPKPPPFETTLRRAAPARIIGQLAKKTPWRGFIDRSLDVAQTAAQYEEAGAAALAVATDGPFFEGALADLTRARSGCKLPLVQEDFVVDAWQLAEARVSGASAVVLIARALEGARLGALMTEARALGLETFVQVYDAEDLDRALDLGAPLVVLDARDPRGDGLDSEIIERLAPAAAKAGAMPIARGGVKDADDVRRLSGAGVEAFFVGEALLRAADRPRAMRALVEALRG